MTLAATLAAMLADPRRHDLALLAGDIDDPVPGDAPRPVEAAVLIAVIDRPVPTVLLTRRTETLRNHAGQVAFPGGRVDPEDADVVAAALREAEEEVALSPSAVEIVGCADRYQTVTNYSVTPVVGVIAPDLPLVPHDDEVAALFEVPLAHLLDPANQQRRSADFRGARRDYYEIDWVGERIWGATAAMLVNLGRRLGPLPEAWRAAEAVRA